MATSCADIRTSINRAATISQRLARKGNCNGAIHTLTMAARKQGHYTQLCYRSSKVSKRFRSVSKTVQAAGNTVKAHCRRK